MRGVGNETLAILSEGGVAAIVGLPRRMPRSPEVALQRQASAVERLAATFDAFLPARFGSIARGEEAVAGTLEKARFELLRALDHVRRRRQMTLHVALADAPAARPPLVRRRTIASTGRTGTTYLFERAAAAGLHRGKQEIRLIREALKPWVRDERLERKLEAPNIRIDHLIDRRDIGRYVSAVATLVAATGLHITVTGPWAAFAFVPEALP